MKAHIGIDSKTKLLHSVAVTAANVHDSQVLEDLLQVMKPDFGAIQRTRAKRNYCMRKPQMHKDYTQHKGSHYRQLTEQEKVANNYKSKTRSRVEHIFGVMKQQFGYRKVQYRGLNKNAHHVFTKCALINLVLAKKQLLAV